MIETKEKVTRIEDLLKEAAVSKANIDNVNKRETAETKINDVKEKEKNRQNVIPRGKPKSGRVWKEQKERFSSIVKSRGIRISQDKKQKLREDLKRVKQLSRDIKAQKEAEKVAKKERRKENLKREQENQKKSEVVQVIKDTAKIKRMKKKQLRSIVKRDTVKT